MCIESSVFSQQPIQKTPTTCNALHTESNHIERRRHSPFYCVRWQMKREENRSTASLRGPCYGKHVRQRIDHCKIIAIDIFRGELLWVQVINVTPAISHSEMKRISFGVSSNYIVYAGPTFIMLTFRQSPHNRNRYLFNQLISHFDDVRYKIQGCHRFDKRNIFRRNMSG